MAEPIRVDSVSRRTVLKGMAGAAGLRVHPRDHRGLQLVGGHRPPRAPPPASAAAQRRRRRRRPRRRAPPPAPSRSGRTTRTRTPTRRPCRPSSTRSPPRPASPSRSTRSTTTRSRTRSARTSRARRTTPSPGSPATGCASSRPRAWPPTSATLWAKIGANFSDAFKAVVDRQRRQAVLRPVLQLPVGRHLPQERLRGQGLHGPEDRGTSSRPSATRCRRTA